MQIRLLEPADAPAYQALRLLALRESPAAFSASHDDEADRPLADVAARIAPAADGSVRMLGVFEDGALAAFVALLHPQRAKLRHAMELAGMYVAGSVDVAWALCCCARRSRGRAPPPGCARSSWA